MKKHNQDQIFAASEGDQWFGRNKAALERFDPETDLPLTLLRIHSVRPTRALEIGAANGYRLAALRKQYAAEVVAVEPSAVAISDGHARYPEVRFVQGLISEVPVTEQFDLVIVNFVFHWVERANLLKAAAEVDRVVEDGGSLIVGDFFPTRQMQVRYHHLPEEQVWTYKQDYSAVFLGTGLYRLAGLITGSHAKSPAANSAEEERTGCWLLRKSHREHYSVIGGTLEHF